MGPVHAKYIEPNVTQCKERKPMIIRTMPVGPLQANCYIVGCEETRHAAVIDPGGDADKILLALAGDKLTLKTIINTHGHFDHVSANKALKKASGAELMIHPLDAPMLSQLVALKKRHAAIICLGAVIRGATPHFDYVSAEVSKGVAMASLETGLPIIFGVLTTDSLEQAIERAGSKGGNKGWDAAIAAVEMANLMDVVEKI